MIDKKLELLFPKYKSEIENPTHEWRTFVPKINYEKCTGCGVCAIYCPDELIEISERDKKKIPIIDYNYCKGCGVCVNVCPFKIIDFKPEEKSLKKIEDISDLLEELYEKKDFVEIVWYGRGGLGVVTASELVANATLKENKYSQSIPIFGPERSGAPVKAYTRVSDEQIRIKSSVYNPDVAVFMDSSFLTRENLRGMRKNGDIIINSSYAYELKGVNIYYLDATKIALETIGKPITSTAMASAVLKVTKLASLESLIESIKERFEGEMMEKNIEAAKRAYENVKGV